MAIDSYVYEKYLFNKNEKPNDFIVIDYGEDQYVLFGEEAECVSHTLDEQLSCWSLGNHDYVHCICIDFFQLFNFLFDNPNAGEQHSNRHLVLVR